MLLEKTVKSPLDSKEIQPVHPKGNQSWIFVARTDAEAETPILWPADAKNWLFGKDPDAGKVWRQEEKGTTEAEMFGWHHRLDGHEFEYAPGAGDGCGSFVCCSPWGHKVGHDWVTELNWRVWLFSVHQVFIDLIDWLYLYVIHSVKYWDTRMNKESWPLKTSRLTFTHIYVYIFCTWQLYVYLIHSIYGKYLWHILDMHICMWTFLVAPR